MDGTEKLNWTIAGGALATSAALAPPPFTASLALGVALEAVNYRALRRATIAAWHLEDPSVRDHEKWRERARRYVELAALTS